MSFYCREPLLFPQLHLYNEQNLVAVHGSDTSDMIEKELYNSYENSYSDDNVFDDDPLCNKLDITSNISDIDLYKFVNLDDDCHLPYRSKFDSGNLLETKPSKIQSVNKLPEFFVFPDIDNGYDSPTSFVLLTNQTPLCILTNQKHLIEILVPNMTYDQNREKKLLPSFWSPFFTEI